MAVPTLTRRQILLAGLGAGAAVALPSCGKGQPTQVAPGRARSANPLSVIDHVVILIQENRSFDHVFGTLSGVRGFDDHPAHDPGVFSQAWPGGSAPFVLPFHLDTSRGAAGPPAECVNDPDHGWRVQHAVRDGGRMDRWVAEHAATNDDGRANGPLVMGYYTRGDLPYHYGLADAYTVCDAYHCSVLGPTMPNRFHSLAASIDEAGAAGGPVVTNPTSPSQYFSIGVTTMPERLQAAGVSWKVYNPEPLDVYTPPGTLAALTSDNVLQWCRAYRNPKSELAHNAFGYGFPDDLKTDVAAGNLPQVSWVLAPDPATFHPPGSAGAAEAFMAQLFGILTSNPKVWAKSVLFVTYDENGGFFDHVDPPVAPPGTPGEYVTASPLPTAASGVAGPIGLGYRVPMLVISPYARGGSVCSDRLDHTSTLRFVESRFGVEVPNLSDWRRGVTGDLSGALDFTHPPGVSIPTLPDPAAEVARVDAECAGGMAEVLQVPPPYPVPSLQAMPVQEPGGRHRVPVRH